MGLLFGQVRTYPSRISELPPHLQRLAVKYRNAVANVLGVPPEAIREDVVVRWVTQWAKAYLKPEWQHVIHSLIYNYEKVIMKGTYKVDSKTVSYRGVHY